MWQEDTTLTFIFGYWLETVIGMCNTKILPLMVQCFACKQLATNKRFQIINTCSVLSSFSDSLIVALYTVDKLVGRNMIDDVNFNILCILHCL